MTKQRGRLATPPELLARIPFARDHRKDPFGPPPYPIDVTGGITDFGMQGNDEYGDCGPADEVHLEMTTAKAAGTTGPDPDSNLAVSRYVAYTGVSEPPGPGVSLGGYLLWCVKQGYILAFAQLGPGSDEVDAAMAEGYGVMVGVDLTDDAEQLFDEGEEWTVANGEMPDPREGHAILKVKADGQGTDAYVTWGAVQLATEAWSAACTQERFLVVTTEEQLAKYEPTLIEAVQALGGDAPSVPEPEPAPTPEGPVPTDGPAEGDAEDESEDEDDLAEVEGYGVMVGAEDEEQEWDDAYDSATVDPRTRVGTLADGTPVDANGLPAGVPYA